MNTINDDYLRSKHNKLEKYGILKIKYIGNINKLKNKKIYVYNVILKDQYSTEFFCLHKKEIEKYMNLTYKHVFVLKKHCINIRKEKIKNILND